MAASSALEVVIYVRKVLYIRTQGSLSCTFVAEWASSVSEDAEERCGVEEGEEKDLLSINSLARFVPCSRICWRWRSLRSISEIPWCTSLETPVGTPVGTLVFGNWQESEMIISSNEK